MNKLEREWMSYLGGCVPVSASLNQINETRKAFYAGAVGMHHILKNAGQTDAEMMETVNGVEEDIQKFFAELKQQMAGGLDG